MAVSSSGNNPRFNSALHKETWDATRALVFTIRLARVYMPVPSPPTFLAWHASHLDSAISFLAAAWGSFAGSLADATTTPKTAETAKRREIWYTRSVYRLFRFGVVRDLLHRQILVKMAIRREFLKSFQ